MEISKGTITGLLTASLMAGLCFSGVAGAQEERSGSGPKSSAQQVQADEQRAPEGVDEAVQQTTDVAVSERRKRLVDDAVEALDETAKALQALERDDVDAALDSLALATGKLDLVVARHPALALAPVDVRLVTYDVYATVDDVKRVTKDARKHLEKGRIQDARRLIEGLRSDLVIEVVNVPLATYPDAIRAISPLIDAGEIQAAKTALQRALNTMVVTKHVHPLPILRAEQMLDRAEELAEAEGRSETQNQELASLIDTTRAELQFAEALGYGTQGEFEHLYEQLDEITRKTSDGKSGSGFFDRIRRALRSFGESDEAMDGSNRE